MDNLNFNIYNVIILAGIIQGLIFSFVVLFHSKYKSKTNSYIVYTVLALSFSNFQYWVDDVNLEGVFSIFINLRIPCDMLIVPFFYLFVSSYLKEKTSKIVLYLLFSPFIISFIFNLSLYKKIFSNTSLNRSINITLESISLVLSLVLIFFIFHKIKKYKIDFGKYNEKIVRAETKWIKQVLIIGAIMCVFWLITIILMQTKLNTGLNIYYPLWLSISALVYWISYVGIINSKINTDRITIRNLRIKDHPTVSKLNITNKKSNIKLFNEINNWIKTNKIYLNPDLNLDYISKEFKISNGYLSQIINTHHKSNFNDYINTLRINNAKQILQDTAFDNYTIESIGLESGFNSKSSFYTAFKKFTNKTPTQYKKNVLNL
ncbi:helix-turn-helix domain-containing protein [Olleya namhaensis]|uniref:helix-turn-helix domain-containing protein n=1 Tax=Olleya namhaensis TaxID=1144750 RepID=UPI00248F95FC|nr:helix-turn-helix domain-containing protein [Olleya namhaensis]